MTLFFKKKKKVEITNKKMREVEFYMQSLIAARDSLLQWMRHWTRVRKIWVLFLAHLLCDLEEVTSSLFTPHL